MASWRLVVALAVNWAVVDAILVNTEAIAAQRRAPPDFCVNGRLAPRFFLLGAPKSGTTYFYGDFARSEGVFSYEPAGTEATWRSKEPWVFAGPFKVSYREAWLSHYPLCSDAPHGVGVDCTPGYFSSPAAPANIARAFGSRLRRQVTFMVFIRSPMVRSLSHYYHFLENGVLDGAIATCLPQQFPPSFLEAAKGAMASNGTACNCACDRVFTDSFYAESFERFFTVFDSSQFHVVPFKLATGHSIVRYTWQLLEIPKGVGERSDAISSDNIKNHHDYPSMEEELGETLPKVTAFMEEKTGAMAVAKLLANSRAHLFGYDGENSVESVASYLSDNW